MCGAGKYNLILLAEKVKGVENAFPKENVLIFLYRKHCFIQKYFNKMDFKVISI